MDDLVVKIAEDIIQVLESERTLDMPLVTLQAQPPAHSIKNEINEN